MATRVVMSKLSPTMEEGRVLHWLKKEGDPVESGDVLLEVETDKANMEVEAMGSGILRNILVPEDATVPTGTLLGVIASEDEDVSAILAEAEAHAAPSDAAAEAEKTAGDEAVPAPEPTSPLQTASPAAAAQEQAEPVEEPQAQAPDARRVKASPLARRMAQERGIELRLVGGSGPGGRIIKRDIEAAATGGAPAFKAVSTELGPEPPYERVELSQLRKAIARNLAQSLGPVPHFFLTTEIDMGRVSELRSELNESLEETGLKIGINEILVKIAAQALLEHPSVNVAFAEDHIRRFTRVDIGIAVAIDDGLITPVLRDAAAKGLRQISTESRELIARARAKKLAPEEYQGATFTISNLGMYDIDEFTAVINPPAATILAVGAIREKPVVVNGAIEIRSRMRVTLSCDHRAVDGAMGAEFLATLRRMLENPLHLVL
jgi:pyruvate dehydrogenase E2 component (dihydrolipoamide acetyltransferase)